ncbi:hypothetical protein HAX54_020992 [Datura stramonium]|uniref:Uncharacterized protein n=1 Tax=Datura stramonium TaxID=4076 RepID=A0ABS8UUD1_DATST|nr:hypothetical protein [Datura stramonium]
MSLSDFTPTKKLDAVLACGLPWLQSLLLQHASGIMSQESSLLALNSLYQTIDDGDDEDGAIQSSMKINDKSDGEGSEVIMETESIQMLRNPSSFSDTSDHEVSDGMSE